MDDAEARVGTVSTDLTRKELERTTKIYKGFIEQKKALERVETLRLAALERESKAVAETTTVTAKASEAVKDLTIQELEHAKAAEEAGYIKNVTTEEAYKAIAAQRAEAESVAALDAAYVEARDASEDLSIDGDAAAKAVAASHQKGGRGYRRGVGQGIRRYTGDGHRVCGYHGKNERRYRSIRAKRFDRYPGKPRRRLRPGRENQPQRSSNYGVSADEERRKTPRSHPKPPRNTWRELLRRSSQNDRPTDRAKQPAPRCYLDPALIKSFKPN